MMNNYRVVLRDKSEFKVKAQDVDVACGSSEENCNSHFHYYNFLVNVDEDGDYDPGMDSITVAAVAFDLVAFVLKEN